MRMTGLSKERSKGDTLGWKAECAFCTRIPNISVFSIPGHF